VLIYVLPLVAIAIRVVFRAVKVRYPEWRESLRRKYSRCCFKPLLFALSFWLNGPCDSKASLIGFSVA
jgi:hypothetical protein